MISSFGRHLNYEMEEREKTQNKNVNMVLTNQKETDYQHA